MESVKYGGHVLFFATFILVSAASFAGPNPCIEATQMVKRGAEKGDGSAEEKKLYDDAIKLCPKVSEAHYNLGVWHIQKKEYIEARKELEKALALKNSIDFRLALAHALLQAKDLGGAESEYRTVLEEDPKNEKAIQGLSVILTDRGEDIKAVPLLDMALEKNPGDETTLYNRAAVAERVESKEIAEKFYRELIKINPAHREGVIRLALILRDSSRLPETKQILRRAVELLPEDLELQRLLASVSEELGDFEDSESVYLLLLSNKPDDKETLINLGSLYLRKRQHQKSLDVLDRALKQPGSQARALTVKGIVLLGLGKLSEAKETLSKAIAEDPTQSVAYYNMSLILRQEGNLKEAENLLERAKALDPKIVE